MGQTELIQALKNLGGSAIGSDLVKEYFKVHYPRDIYTDENLKVISRTMEEHPDQYWRLISKYLSCCKKNGLIGRRVVKINRPLNAYKYFRTVRTEYYLLNKNEYRNKNNIKNLN